ncbi:MULTISPECIES: protein-disulfide reductase DsbD domain-containing protein [unclassified Roseitalea]|uniref:protein-disulfide reductase DsbD domain-containing protein n=1 Tax=unclassified Roseitalea TaxID=2639107 RepID=UPI00273F1CFA|nr:MULTISPECIES: protein-disulfide reductase DsbD domain-containing protein [unclassified Roseitalea]
MTRLATIAAAAALLATAAAPPAEAQTTPWFDTVGGAVRLVVEPPAPDAETIRGALEIELDQGWKTYWREPGSSGIPPQVEIGHSRGIGAVAIGFPAPVWIENPYGDFAGYDAPVALPLTFTRTANGAAELVADVFLGICEDICIPVQTRFELKVEPANGSTLDGMRVARAHDRLPGSPHEGFSLAEEDEAGLIAVDHRAAGKTPPAVFVHARDGTQFLPPIHVGTRDGVSRYRLEPVRPSPDGRAVDTVVTVRAGEHAFEASHEVRLAGENR